MSFNPRAREGRDQMYGVKGIQSYGFNPRAREGRDAPHRGAVQSPQGFNPRAREGRDDLVRGKVLCCSACFNPRAREGRDIFEMFLYVSREVSIHAPARGATICSVY